MIIHASWSRGEPLGPLMHYANSEGSFLNAQGRDGEVGARTLWCWSNYVASGSNILNEPIEPLQGTQDPHQLGVIGEGTFRVVNSFGGLDGLLQRWA